MFKGVGTALITPFDKDQNIDYNSFKKIINHQINGGVDALILLGTTGESPVIDDEERKKLIEFTVAEANGKALIIVGTGTNNTKKVVKLNKMAAEGKADGVLIVNPYYNKGTQASLIDHYRYISERTNLPIILYNVPSRTGMNMLPETITEIHTACPNVVAVKEASGNISQIAKLISIKDDSLAVLSGNDDQTLPIMALGGAGIISVFSNAFPGQLKLLTDSILQENLSRAQYYNNLFMKMMNLLFVETSPSPIKFVMSKLGFCENILRLPMAPVTKSSMEILTAEIEKVLTLKKLKINLS